MAVARRTQHFSATHFLAFPLYNSGSASRLESFAHRLKNDEYAEGIPQKAFRSPRSYHTTVAKLRLETHDDVKAASDLLRRLDIQCILKDMATSTATAKTNNRRVEENDNSQTHISFGSLVPVLQISLTGVRVARKPNTERIKSLYGAVDEASGRSRGLIRRVRHEFASADFQMYSGYQNNEEDFARSRSLDCELLSSTVGSKVSTFVDYTGSTVRKSRELEYDAAPLSRRYENVEIARDITIEKLSLYKQGRKRTFSGDNKVLAVDEYYEEIESVPMPQETKP